MTSTTDPCAGCCEPTKRVAAFWDGCDSKEDIVCGCSYVCENYACPVAVASAKENERQMVMLRDMRRKVIDANIFNGVSAKALEQVRVGVNITIYELAQHLGITPSDYCRMRREQVPIERDMFDRAIGWLLSKTRS